MPGSHAGNISPCPSSLSHPVGSIGRYIDNQPVLDLIEKGTSGILVMLDEEVRVPRGSDTTYLNKIDKAHSSDER